MLARSLEQVFARRRVANLVRRLCGSEVNGVPPVLVTLEDRPVLFGW
jgi:hypothetical protein